MVDLKMTNTGDILVVKQEQLPSFHLIWRNASYPTFRLRWKQGRSKEEEDAHGFCLKIRTSEKEKKKVSKTVYDNDEIKQRIIMELRTEYGDIANRSQYGSYLSLYKHEDITSSAIIRRIKSAIEGVVEKYLSSPTVEVKHAYGTGAFYCQNLNIYIYDNGRPFFEFVTEEIFG